MIETTIYVVFSMISAVIIGISTVLFTYILYTVSKLSSRENANKMFGAFIINNSDYFLFAFISLAVGGIFLAIGFSYSFIGSFIFSNSSQWTDAWAIPVVIGFVLTSIFFAGFTAVFKIKYWFDYIKNLKKEKTLKENNTKPKNNI